MYILQGILFALFGLFIGSFSNVLINHYTNGITLTEDHGRSVCPKCNHRLAWYDNIPILSYILLKGKCRYCHEKISIQFPIIETMGLLAGISTYLFFNFQLFTPNAFIYAFDYKSIIYGLFIIFLIDAAVIDAKTKEIPYSLTIILACLALANYICYCSLTLDYGLDYIIGAFSPLVLLFILYFVVLLVAKAECIGIGDIFLFGIIGLLLGYKNLIFIVMISSISCTIVLLIKICKTKKKEEFPFIPYIAFGTILGIFFGELAVNGYLSLIGLN